MRHLPKPRRRRHAAMKDVGGSDDHGERARSGRGVKSSDRPGSPPREPGRSPSSRALHRYSRPEHASHDRYHSRDRSREHPRRRLSESSRRGAEVEDLIPRYRATKARHEPDDKPSRRSRSRERAGPSSPSSSKRHRGRSHSPDRHHRKRSKKDHSPSRRDRDHSRDPDSRKHRRRSPHDRHEPSHRRHAHSHRSPTQSEDTHSRHKRRSRSRTPIRHDLIPRQAVSRESRESRHPKATLPPPPPSRSPSPKQGRRHGSARRATPPARSDQPGKTSNAATGDWSGADPDHRPSSRHAPPRSPRAHRERRRRDGSAEPYHSSRSDVDDDMASRSSYRGGHNPMYAHKPYYNNDPRGGDPQAYTQSPQQGGSYHNSPTMSPYGAYRGGWAGQYSPQQYVTKR